MRGDGGRHLGDGVVVGVEAAGRFPRHPLDEPLGVLAPAFEVVGAVQQRRGRAGAVARSSSTRCTGPVCRGSGAAHASSTGPNRQIREGLPRRAGRTPARTTMQTDAGTVRCRASEIHAVAASRCATLGRPHAHVPQPHSHTARPHVPAWHPRHIAVHAPSTTASVLPRPSSGAPGSPRRAPGDARPAHRRATDRVPRSRCPITARRDELVAAIRDHQVIVVAGETGSGKSTQLPKLCLEAGRGVDGLIGHTQPRRVAARTVAERVADELGTTIGDGVGYTVRFNDQVGDGTLVRVMTDGILLNELHRDRELRRYDTLIIDEAHERSLNIDFILGYLKQLLPRRPDLKVIVTSATIDTERFAAHFAGPDGTPAPVLIVEGRTFPVEVRYRPYGGDDPDDPNDDRDQVRAVVDAVRELTGEGPGDVLVFLSRRARDPRHRRRPPRRGRARSAAARRRGAAALRPPVVGRAAPHLRAAPRPARRAVHERRRDVDHRARRALRRRRRHGPHLALQPPAEGAATADRTGLAGVGQPARRALRPRRAGHLHPPLHRGRLRRAARVHRARDPAHQPRVGHPADDRDRARRRRPRSRSSSRPTRRRSATATCCSTSSARSTTTATIATAATLSKIGRQLARLPVDPRLGRMVIEADRDGCVREVLVIAVGAVDPGRPRAPRADGGGEKPEKANELHQRFDVEGTDLLSIVALWDHLREQQRALSGNQFRRLCRDEYLNYLRVREWRDLYSQLRQVAGQLGVRPGVEAAHPDHVHRAVLSGCCRTSACATARAASSRAPATRGSSSHPGSVLTRRPPQWVMAAELVETTQLWARRVAAVQPEWAERLAPHLVKRSYGEPWWDARVRARRHVRDGDAVRPADRVEPHDRRRPRRPRARPARCSSVTRSSPATGRPATTSSRATPSSSRGCGCSRPACVAATCSTTRRCSSSTTSASARASRRPASSTRGGRTSAATEPDLLDLDPSVLASRRGIVLADYPDTWRPPGWQPGDAEYPISYRYDPDTPLDGATLHGAAAALNQLTDRRVRLADPRLPRRAGRTARALAAEGRPPRPDPDERDDAMPRSHVLGAAARAGSSTRWHGRSPR